jgi:hypothetical protein
VVRQLQFDRRHNCCCDMLDQQYELGKDSHCDFHFDPSKWGLRIIKRRGLHNSACCQSLFDRHSVCGKWVRPLDMDMRRLERRRQFELFSQYSAVDSDTISWKQWNHKPVFQSVGE